MHGAMGQPWDELSGLAEWPAPGDEAAKRGVSPYAPHALQPPLHAMPGAGLCWTDETVADAILRDPRASLSGPPAFAFSAAHSPLLRALLEPQRHRCAPPVPALLPARQLCSSRRGGRPTSA
jgi:hypothetical protein